MPFMPAPCAKSLSVEPSSAARNAMGLTVWCTPWSSTSERVRTTSSIDGSITSMEFSLRAFKPTTTQLPSGLTYTLWMPVVTGMLATFSCVSRSNTSTNGSAAIPT